MAILGARRKKQRRARKAVLRLVRYLRKVCDSVEDPDQWDRAIQQGRDWLKGYGEYLPTGALEQYDEAARLVDRSVEAVHRACTKVQEELGKVLERLPSPGLVSSFLTTPTGIAATVVVALVAAGAVAYPLTSSQLTITNGCEERLHYDSPVPFLPSVDVPPGGSQTVSVPPFSLTGDRQGSTYTITTLGQRAVRFTGQADVAVIYDGEPVEEGRHSLSLGPPRSSHTLDLRCP